MAATIAITAAPAMAQDRQALPGWGPFKFGMSRDDIIAQMGDRVTRAQVGPRLLYSAEIEGTPYSASLAFDANLRLAEAHVSQSDTTNLEQDDCTRRAAQVQALLVKRYGAPDIDKDSRQQVAGFKSEDLYVVSEWKFADASHIEAYMLVAKDSFSRSHFKCAVGANYFMSPQKPPGAKETF